MGRAEDAEAGTSLRGRAKRARLVLFAATPRRGRERRTRTYLCCAACFNTFSTSRMYFFCFCVRVRARKTGGERENAGRARETRARRVDEGATRRVTRTAELRCRVWDILKNRCDFHTIPPDACVVDAPCVSPKCRAENQRDGDESARRATSSSLGRTRRKVRDGPRANGPFFTVMRNADESTMVTSSAPRAAVDSEARR